jgi:hypothetical protein
MGIQVADHAFPRRRTACNDYPAGYTKRAFGRYGR